MQNPLLSWRARNRLSQTEAGLVLGVSTNSIGLIERGDPEELYPTLVDGLRTLVSEEEVEALLESYRSWRAEKVDRMRRQAGAGG